MTQGYIAIFARVAVYVDGVEYRYSYINVSSSSIIDYGGGTYGQNHSFYATPPLDNLVFDHWDCRGAESVFSDINVHSNSNSFSTQWQSGQGRAYEIYLTAYFKTLPYPPEHDSAIDLRLVGVPPNVGSLIGGGLRTGEVGASVTYSVIAELLEEMKGRYRFLYWLDDQNVRHDSKSFSKAFTFQAGYSQSNPEVKTFTAHFAASTGLILRSSSSGLILRGKANMILRDA